MSRKSWKIISILGAVFVLVIGALQWWKFYNFGYNGLDLGIYSQTIWSLAHGHGFASSIHDPSYLGDHLEVWLVPISWLYRLWESPLLLLWVQTLVIASSVIPLAKIINRLLSGRAAVVATALFIVHPLVYNLSLYEFHGLVFALPLILWSIWFYIEKRLSWWLLSLLTLVIVREDMPFIVAGWAVMAAIDRRSWRWWLPPIFLAAVWFPAAQTIIKTANHDGLYKYLAFYGWMGSSLPEILTFPFRHPLVFLQHIITFNNLGTIIGLVVTFGFLPLLRPKRLWPLIIIFAQLLIGNAQPGSFLKIHYPLPYLPFLFWAALETYRAISSGRLYYRRFGPSISLTIAMLLIIIGPVYSSLIVGPFAWPWSNVRVEASTSPEVLRQALNDVNPQDRVLTTFAYLPNFANREALYSLNYLYLGRRQYSEIPYRIPTDIDIAVIDWQQLYEFQFLYKTSVYANQSGLQRIQAFLDRQGLAVSERYGSVAVYRRGGQVQPIVTEIADSPDRTENNFGVVGILEQPQLVVSGRELRIISAWQAHATKPDDLVSVRYIFKQGGQIAHQQSQIVGQGTSAVSEWAENSTWKTEDVVVLPAQLHGVVDVTAEIFIPQGRYRLNRLQTFRPIIDRQKILGTFTLGKVTL